MRTPARGTTRPAGRSALPLLAALSALLGLAGPSQAPGGQRPNILFIMSDDHGYQALSCYGSVRNETPHLDRLAREGMRFDRCYVTNSICGPSRAVILTGKYSHLNGVIRNGLTFNGAQQTVAKLLRNAGYQTAMVGKWHLRSEPTGFDYWHVLIGQGPYYNPPMKTPEGTVKHTGYTTDIITDQALDWLKNKRDKNKPFFLMYHHKAPHRNWQPGPKYLNKYDDEAIPEPETLFDDYSGRGTPAKTQKMTIANDLNPNDLKLVAPRGLTEGQRKVWDRAYAAKNEKFQKANLQGEDLVRWKYQRYVKDYLRCIDSVDENVGRVLDYLDESGLADSTAVFYTSDQGWYLGEHGWFDKRWMYEESFRTPLLVRWPGKAKPGGICTAMAMNLDFAETFLEIAGAPIPDDMQGCSLVPLFSGETPADWRKSIYYHYYEYPGAHSVRRHYGVRTERYKLIYFYEDDVNEWELYDLEKDPREMKSVYDDPGYADVVKDLKRQLQRLRDRYGDHGQVVDFGKRRKAR
jgi:arylsulfatase A-like enzyme